MYSSGIPAWVMEVFDIGVPFEYNSISMNIGNRIQYSVVTPTKLDNIK